MLDGAEGRAHDEPSGFFPDSRLGSRVVEEKPAGVVYALHSPRPSVKDSRRESLEVAACSGSVFANTFT